MSKAGRERSARQKLVAERTRQAARQRRRRALFVMLSAVAGAAVIVVVVVVAAQNGGGGAAQEYTGALAPATRQRDGSIVMARPGVTKPVLVVFEDFQCPACRKLEETSGKTIKQLAAEGAVRVLYRPFRLFPREPLKSNSQRAANAAECAPADKWVRYHDKIFANQPDEGDKGFSNKDLIAWAAEVGISGQAFTTCVDKGQKNSVVDRATESALKAGVQSTPTLVLNGKVVQNELAASPEALEKAIKAAA